MIDFICDGCHTQLQIGDQWAGKLGRCPHCRTQTSVPGNPKRTPKRKMIFRMTIIPLAVLGFWASFLATVGLAVPFLLGGVLALTFAIGFCWAVTNVVMFFWCPKHYRIWKKGGGDPFFDTLDWPFNTDPPSTRYQELYREKARLECEAMFPPPVAPDPSRSIDDPDII